MEKDKNDNIIINTLQDKLDIIGTRFASINNRVFNNNRPQLNNIINKKVVILKNQIEKSNNTTICTCYVLWTPRFFSFKEI